MVDKLKYIYDDIYRWLIFAEAKNLGFLAILGFILELLLNEKEKLLFYFDFFFYIFLFFCLLILLILVVSFVPFLNRSAWICRMAYRIYANKITENQIFYINIFLVDYEHKFNSNSEEQLSVESLLELNDVAEIDNFTVSLVTQIKETAKVATIKYALFHLATKVFFGELFLYIFNIFLCA